MPKSLPSASTAISSDQYWSRSCAGVGEMLAPVLDPFDRALHELGGRDHGDVLGIDAELRPKAAADVGVATRRALSSKPSSAVSDWNRSCAFWVEAQTVMPPSLGRHSGEDAAAFDRMRGTAMLPKLLVEDVRGLAEGGIDVAIGHLVGGGDIAVELAADRRSVRRRRLAAVGHAREQVVGRPRPAPRRPRRDSGCRPARSRQPRRHTRSRRQRARTTRTGRVACRSWNGAAYAAAA